MAGLRADVMAQSLSARVEGDRLRVGVESVRFLKGDPLRRLQDGGSVVYIFRVTALTSLTGSVLAKAEYRFVISYDIFEEKFQVSRIRPTARVVSHLTQAAAEALCMDSLELPIQSLSTSRPFWLRLEYEAEVSTETESSGALGGLVEVFSRKPASEPSRGVVQAGPLQLSNLPRSAPARGGTNP
jgi:hypothetical protein